MVAVVLWYGKPTQAVHKLALIMFSEHLDMPYLSGGWLILAKERC